MRRVKTHRIAEVGTVVTGKTPPTKDIANFGSAYPFLTPSDMQGAKWARRTERGISEVGASKLRCQVPARAVAVSCIGWQMGKAILTYRPTYTNQQINTIIPNKLADPEYLYYYFATRRDELLSIGSAGGVRTPIISKSSFERLEIELPPVQVQRRIAAMLAAYDDLIENNARRIAILEEIARRIYEEWFVRFRFPGHDENVRIIKSGVGPVPKGWQVASLKDLADVNRRSIKRGNEPDEIAYVDISSVSTASINHRERMPFSNAPGRARRIVRDGDIIWACVRPNRKSYAIILDPEPDLVVSTGFAVLSATAVPWTYLYQVVTTEDFVGYLVNHAKGAAYPAVGAEDFETAKVLKPDEAILQRFHEVTEPMARLCAALAAKNRTLRATRDLLLPELISGELDVSAFPEPEAAAA